MRNIKYIAIHCTATPQTTKISSIQEYWKKVLKWKSPGYHVIVKPDGEAVQLLPYEQVSNGVKGYNSVSINISYIGGVSGRVPVDNRTEAQKRTLHALVCELKHRFPNAKVQGHRDFPDVAKDCPSFDAIPEYAHI